MLQRNSSNDYAVLDLPMGLVVSLIIGSVCLLAILSLMLQASMIPGNLQVEIQPGYILLNDSNALVNVSVLVTDSTHHPIHNAIVIIRGYHCAVGNRTNESGYIVEQISPKMQPGLKETFLEITVQAKGFTDYQNPQGIRVLLSE